MDYELYYNKDKTRVAVLTTADYGSGWSTANNCPQMAFDRRIVSFFNDKNVEPTADDWRKFLIHLGIDKKVPNGDLNLGGANDLVVDWVPVNTTFRISEYDGYEAIEFFDPNKWFRF